MRQVRVEEAVGQVLAHDLTQIIPGKFKGARYRKGHVIASADVPNLLKMGKDHIYILEMHPGELHEDAAATALARSLGGPNISLTVPEEGKVNLVSAVKGLLKVKAAPINNINNMHEIAVGTLHNNSSVEAGDVVAATRVIPLLIKKEVIEIAQEVWWEANPVLQVKAYKPLRAGLITTGNEIYYGRLKDKFSPVIRDKVAAYSGSVVEHYFCPDDFEAIKEKVLILKEKGLDLIVLTGGMSVDPDDRTPGAIKASGADVVVYGTPVLPGSMFLLAYLDETPVLGVPGCAMYAKTTVLDLVLPRIFAGERVKREEVLSLGVGGLCRSCPSCHYPHCSFGKK